MSTATARRPAATRGGKGNSAKVAYDLGRAGEDAPAWLADSPAAQDAYNRGVDDRDAAEAGAPRRKGPPAERPTLTAVPDAPASAPQASNEDGKPDTTSTSSLSSSSGSRRGPIITSSTADSIGSALAGALVYVLGLAYIRGGWPAVKQWLSAKFTNGGGKLP